MSHFCVSWKNDSARNILRNNQGKKLSLLPFQRRNSEGAGSYRLSFFIIISRCLSRIRVSMSRLSQRFRFASEKREEKRERGRIAAGGGERGWKRGWCRGRGERYWFCSNKPAAAAAAFHSLPDVARRTFDAATAGLPLKSSCEEPCRELRRETW